jgi:hypothetical protein
VSRPDRVSLLRTALVPTGVAILAGCAAIGAANLTVRALCLASDTAYHSKLGFIFQWRIAFIESRPAPERAAFFDALCARLRDPLAIRALRAYAAAIDAGQNPSAEFLNEYIKEALKKDPDYNRKERLIFTADSLGHIASTTVTSFPPGYVDAVSADFRKNFTLHLDAITREPAASTQFFTTALAAPEFRPLRNLVTFRDGYYQRAVPDFSSRPYLRLGRGISLLTLTLAALILWLATLARSDRRSWHVVYPPSLLTVGGILIFLNCCTTFFMPRFALPLLGTILAASLISIAGLLEWISVRKSQRPDPVSTSQAPR